MQLHTKYALRSFAFIMRLPYVQLISLLCLSRRDDWWNQLVKKQDRLFLDMVLISDPCECYDKYVGLCLTNFA